MFISHRQHAVHVNMQDAGTASSTDKQAKHRSYCFNQQEQYEWCNQTSLPSIEASFASRLLWSDFTMASDLRTQTRFDYQEMALQQQYV
jgi:hypothetical protein